MREEAASKKTDSSAKGDKDDKKTGAMKPAHEEGGEEEDDELFVVKKKGPTAASDGDVSDDDDDDEMNVLSGESPSLDDLLARKSKSKQKKATKLKIRADGSAKGVTAILGANKILFDEDGESIANPLLADSSGRVVGDNEGEGEREGLGERELESSVRKRTLKTSAGASSAEEIRVKMEEYARRVKARSVNRDNIGL